MEPIIRYNAPTRYDLAPYGSICKVMEENESYKLYFQISESPDTATWITVGELLEKTFNSFLMDNEFINACIDIYTNKPGAHMEVIVSKIKG